VQYKPGKRLTNADGLSRRDYPSQEKCLHSINFVYDSVTDDHGTADNTDAYNSVYISALDDSVDVSDAQHQCPDFKDIIDYLRTGTLSDDNKSARRTVLESEQYTLLNDTLYHLYMPRHKGKDRVHPVVQQLCLPRTLRQNVLKAYHDDNGHIGFDKLYASIRAKYYWPKMYADLSDYVRSCSDCQQTKRPIHHRKAPLKLIPVEDVFSRFHLDYLGPLPASDGFRYMLVAIDSTSLYPEIHPTKTCDADETAQVLYDQVFSRYGCPLSILTDRGSCFRSSLVTALCKLFKVKQIFTSSYHPQTNSRAENMNSIILKSLRIYCKDQSQWSTFLPAIAWAYRASATTSHQFSPFEVLFGTKMRAPIDTSILNDVRTSPNIDTYLQYMIPKIELTREIAKQNMHDCNANTQFYYDRNAAYPRYAVGQTVLLYDSANQKGVCKKLKRRWIGPFFITAKGDGYVYKLRRCSDGQELRSFIHSNRLRPFHEPRDHPPAPTPSNTSTPPPATSQPATLDDGWYKILKVSNSKKGKTHFLVHWTDGSKSYEPEENVTDYAKAQYYARCQSRRRPRR